MTVDRRSPWRNAVDPECIAQSYAGVLRTATCKT